MGARKLSKKGREERGDMTRREQEREERGPMTTRITSPFRLREQDREQDREERGDMTRREQARREQEREEREDLRRSYAVNKLRETGKLLAERGAMGAGQPQPGYNRQGGGGDLRVQGYPVGPMVQQDIANDQRMNELRERAAQERNYMAR
jgi:hypothetical protein